MSFCANPASFAFRKIIEDGNLEAETIDAQREEAERKARLLEKLQQQAQELRRQRDLERQQSVAEAEEVARKAMDQLKNMQLKSLLEGRNAFYGIEAMG